MNCDVQEEGNIEEAEPDDAEGGDVAVGSAAAPALQPAQQPQPALLDFDTDYVTITLEAEEDPYLQFRPRQCTCTLTSQSELT